MLMFISGIFNLTLGNLGGGGGCGGAGGNREVMVQMK